MRVLVVDDDPDIARLVRDVTTSMGHEVTVAERGSEAIQAALTADFDLLICDLMLPDLNGTEVVRALKAQAPQLPVIIVSATDPSDYQHLVEEAGASCFLQKPVPVKRLKEEIELVAMARAQLRILVIDPDPIHRVHLSKILEAAGSTVTTYDSSDEAKAAAENDNPSLVMLDAGLNDAVDTLKWAKSVGTPAFIYAEADQADQEDRFMRAGASLFLTKPINSDALLTQARFLANF